MKKPVSAELFNIREVEREIEKAMHRTTVPQLNFRSTEDTPIPKFSPVIDSPMIASAANDVAMQYEAAALEVEAMGVELKDAAQRAVDMAAKISEALQYVADTAAAYRSEAKLIFERIESVSEMATVVTRTCTELKKRMVTDTQLGEGKS